MTDDWTDDYAWCPICEGGGWTREIEPMRSDEWVACPDCGGTGSAEDSLTVRDGK